LQRIIRVGAQRSARHVTFREIVDASLRKRAATLANYVTGVAEFVQRG